MCLAAGRRFGCFVVVIVVVVVVFSRSRSFFAGKSAARWPAQQQDRPISLQSQDRELV